MSNFTNYSATTYKNDMKSMQASAKRRLSKQGYVAAKVEPVTEITLEAAYQEALKNGTSLKSRYFMFAVKQYGTKAANEMQQRLIKSMDEK